MSEVDASLIVEDAGSRRVSDAIRRQAVADDAREAQLILQFLDELEFASGPALPTPAEYMKKTDIGFFKPRGKETKAVDDAYPPFRAAYEAARGDRANRSLQLRAMTLVEAFDALLRSKGNHWDNVDRNVDGILQRIFDCAEGIGRPLLLAQQSREQTALANDMIHARFGVLNLLGNVTIDVDWAPVIIGGVADIGAATTIAGFDAGYGDIGAATKHELAGVVKVATVATGTQTITKAVGGAVAKPSAFTKRIEEQSASRRIEADWFYTPTFPLTRAALDAVGELSDDAIANEAVATYHGTAIVGAVIVDTAYTAIRSIIQPLYKIVIEIINKVRDACFKDELLASRITGAVVKTIASLAIQEICKAAVPFVGGGQKIFTGVCQMALAIKERTALYLDRRMVKLTEGHFTLIGDAVESQVTRGLFLGLWNSLKGAADIAANVFLPGCGSLSSAILTALEWAVRFTGRICEHACISHFLDLAARRWRIEKQNADRVVDPSHPSIVRYRAGPHSFARDLDTFKTYFALGCEASVLIPMLTLNSGMCGSITEQIEMFSNGRRVSQREFDAGVAYFSRLKRISSRYMRASGFNFTGRNGLEGIVAHAVRDHGGSSTSHKILTALAT
jgi:hypothetical protein